MEKKRVVTIHENLLIFFNGDLSLDMMNNLSEEINNSDLFDILAFKNNKLTIRFLNPLIMERKTFILVENSTTIKSFSDEQVKYYQKVFNSLNALTRSKVLCSAELKSGLIQKREVCAGDGAANSASISISKIPSLPAQVISTKGFACSNKNPNPSRGTPLKWSRCSRVSVEDASSGRAHKINCAIPTTPP